MENTYSHFDYIIAGAGCAGLSLLMRLQAAGITSGKKILLVDQSPRQKNDRTWCFWEKEKGFFEEVVHHSWPRVSFFSERWASPLNIAPYTYKMIRSIDFYAYCMERIRKDAGITVLYGEVTDMKNRNDGLAEITVNGNVYTAGKIFSSILTRQPVLKKSDHYLLQHFKGWVVRSEKPVFDPANATLMDFRVDQAEGTTFVYVLPVSRNEALVEYTLFTENLLEPELYDQALQAYVSAIPGIGQWDIRESETGVIPMTNHRFPSHEGNIFYIGTAGGQTKASSGYTFRFIQKHSAALAEALLNNLPLQSAYASPKKFRFYDSVLLRILRYRTLEGADIFTDLFRNGKAPAVFRFLDNETGLLEDIDIMRRLPVLPFARAAMKELF